MTEHLTSLDEETRVVSYIRSVCECGWHGPWCLTVQTAQGTADHHVQNAVADEMAADADYMVDQAKEEGLFDDFRGEEGYE